MGLRDCRAQRRTPGRRRVMCVAGAQTLDRTLDDCSRRRQIRIADAENDHVLAALARRDRRVVGQPRLGAVAADPLHEW